MRSSLLFRRWRRVLLTLIPLALALLHVSAAMPLPLLERLDQFIYDARLRLGMSRTLDERIVIVDIDEKSIDRIGRWPWGRDKLAGLTQELFARQRVSVVGFDVVFAERDNSSGLASLRALEQGAFAKTPRLCPTGVSPGPFAGPRRLVRSQPLWTCGGAGLLLHQ